MPVGAEIDDPLLRAVAELRAEVNRLIDEQVAAAKERAEEPAPTRALRPAPVLGVTEAQAEIDMARPLDPRQRLDALAKRLDHRRRLAGVPTPERAPTPES